MNPDTDPMISLLNDLDVPAEIKTTFFMMGYCLFNVQSVELSLKSALCIPFALQDLDSEDEANRQKTLGTLLHKLRERVDIDSDLELLLRSFVNNRNMFVHHLLDLHDPQTREGLVQIATFSQELAIQAREIAKYLNAAIVASSPGMTFDGADATEVQELVPLIDTMLRRK